MPPTITKEGQRAKNSIAEARQNVNNGATPEQARKIVRFIENPNDTNQQSALNAGVGRDVLRAPTTPNIQPTVSANDLTNPPTKLNMPTPTVGTIPERTGRIVSNVTRDVNGFISAQTEEAQRLKQKQEDYAAFADQGTLQELFTNTMSGAGVTPASFKELKDIDLQLADANTASDLTKTRITGASGQTLGQAQREVTQEDRENAVRNSGLAARAEVLRGNIETATALAKDTVAIAFQDRTLKAQNMLQQIEFLQERVDDQTSQLLEQEKRDYEAELARVEELKTNISTAMVNGASQSEIMQMNDPTIDDATKLALAQSITARGANQMRNLEMEQMQASIANSYDAIAARAEQNKALLGTLNGKAQTEGERLTEVYANRMLEADSIIATLGDQFAKPEAIIGEYTPNILQSEDRQKFEQAQRNFINAVLRKESGAVIGDSEFASARMQYFPQPGDSPGTLQQKEQNRRTAISGLYNAANVPMPELQMPDATTPLVNGATGQVKSGLTYTIIME